VNPCEPLHISGDNFYRACNLVDEENYGIIQEDDLPSSFNVEISKGLDSLVRDHDDVAVVAKKRKREPAQKKKNEMVFLWDKETT
jgi:hypothetical protein